MRLFNQPYQGYLYGAIQLVITVMRFVQIQQFNYQLYILHNYFYIRQQMAYCFSPYSAS